MGAKAVTAFSGSYLMARFARRLPIVAAVALVVLAQAVVSPASCCLLRAALVGTAACCHVPAEKPAAPPCCRARETKAGENGIVGGHQAPRSGECLWCSAEPKVVANDRLALPLQDATPALPTVAVVEPDVAVPTPSEFIAKEPFRRTAPAICAWLCVWRK